MSVSFSTSIGVASFDPDILLLVVAMRLCIMIVSHLSSYRLRVLQRANAAKFVTAARVLWGRNFRMAVSTNNKLVGKASSWMKNANLHFQISTHHKDP